MAKHPTKDDSSFLLRKATSEEVTVESSSEHITKFLQEKGLNELPERTLPWTVSTEARDRDNDRILQSGWELKNYLKNPVVMWGHDYSLPPIGRSIATWVEGIEGQKSGRNAPRLRMLKQFTSQDENPDGFKIFKLAQSGFIKTASVGFVPREAEPDPDFKLKEGEDAPFFTPMVFRRQELLESSIVSIPSNPEALQSAKSICGVDPEFLKPSIEKYLDESNFYFASRQHLENVYKVFQKTPISIIETKADDIEPIIEEPIEATEAIEVSEAEPISEEPGSSDVTEGVSASSPLENELTDDALLPSDDDMLEFELDDLSQALASIMGSGEAV